MYSSNQIAQIIQAKTQGKNNNSVKLLLTDSRQLTEPEQTLFIALITERHDAHHYITSLYKKGVKNFIVQYVPEECKQYADCVFFIVENSLTAMQKLVAFHRSQFNLPVIAITGSNGKTIVKEWLYQLLKSDYNICRSPKSYNSQIGVPLSVWQLNHSHTLGIFEAGISKPHEMGILNQIIKPNIGVFTFYGSAHDEGFLHENEKLKEKLLLFKNCSDIIINGLSLDQNQLTLLPNSNVFLISQHQQAQLRIIEIQTDKTNSRIKAVYKNQELSIQIPFTDRASIDNAITCWATMLHLKINTKEIEQRMHLLQPVAMRLELKLGNNNCVLINDFYNSDIHALEIALHHQKQQHRGGKKIVILSDIEQSGKSNNDLYQNVSALMTHFKIDLIIGIGKEISSQKNLFKCNAVFFNSTSDFIKESLLNTTLHFNNSIILLKGARRFGFEEISKLLQQKSHDTVLEINLNQLIHNLNFYRSQIDKKTKLMCMVKATGYGSGGTEIAFTLQHHRVDYLAVAYTDEGVELRKAGIHLPIMVMSPEESSYNDLIDYRLEPEIFSFKILKEFLQAIQRKAIAEPYPIHLKLDTGMHRLGFEEKDINELIPLIKSESTLMIKSIFSHLVASDDKVFDEFTNQQINSFERMCKQIENSLGYEVTKHICNSGAITRFKQAHYDMVRLGIGMYGVGFNTFEIEHLQNISTLKTKISQIKHVEPGDTVGYSRKGVITKKTKIATIPIGYADGFSRKLGNGNFSVQINNQSCPTIGNICMDMCMVDITNVDCKEGDEVIIFDNNEQLMKLSRAMDTIPYEVLTNISSRVKRVYVQE